MANYPELTPVPDPPEDAYEWRSNSTGIDFYLPTVASLADVPKSLAYFAESISKDQVYDDAYLSTTGGAMTGDIDLGGNTISNSADPGNVTVVSPVGEGSVGARNIYLSTVDPVDEGADGDIWVKYIPQETLWTG